MHDECGGRRGGLFEESVKVCFPSRTRYYLWGVEGVEIVKDFVDLLDFIVDRSCASQACEGY